MALTWDVSKVKDYAEKWPDRIDGNHRQWNLTTDALVWASLAIDMCEITENNAEEWYIRIHMWEEVIGPFRSGLDENGERKDVFFTYEEIVGHIGMRTNVSHKHQNTFNAKVGRILRDHAETALKNAKEERKTGPDAGVTLGEPQPGACT
jgi:hypothetical protein